MNKHLEIARKELVKYLEELDFDTASINRIAQEDFPFLVNWVIEPSNQDKLDTAEAIISFAFGFGPRREDVQYPSDQYHPRLYKPGKSNEGLADVIVPFTRRRIPIFAQWEVAEALKERGITVPDSQIARPDRRYLGTSGVIEQFLTSGLANFGSVIIVAHPHHVFRCQEIAKTVFQKNEEKIKILIADTRSVPYDPDSVQPWTRSLKDWVEYEVGNRFYNRYRGNM